MTESYPDRMAARRARIHAISTLLREASDLASTPWYDRDTAGYRAKRDAFLDRKRRVLQEVQSS